MKLRIRKKKTNECDGMNNSFNTNGIGDPTIGNLNGNFGSGDLWDTINFSKTPFKKNKKKK